MTFRGGALVSPFIYPTVLPQAQPFWLLHSSLVCRKIEYCLEFLRLEDTTHTIICIRTWVWSVILPVLVILSGCHIMHHLEDEDVHGGPFSRKILSINISRRKVTWVSFDANQVSRISSFQTPQLDTHEESSALQDPPRHKVLDDTNCLYIRK